MRLAVHAGTAAGNLFGSGNTDHGRPAEIPGEFLCRVYETQGGEYLAIQPALRPTCTPPLMKRKSLIFAGDPKYDPEGTRWRRFGVRFRYWFA